MTNAPTPVIGHDLVVISRFARVLERHERAFARRVFTEGEWAYVARRPDRHAALAARFAAKEAVMKALGTGWGQGVRWLDVEVVGGERKPPSLALHGEAQRRAESLGLRFQVSLSHAGDMASAMVLGTPA